MNITDWAKARKLDLREVIEFAESVEQQLTELPANIGFEQVSAQTELDAAFESLRDAIDRIDARLFRLRLPSRFADGIFD